MSHMGHLSRRDHPADNNVPSLNPSPFTLANTNYTASILHAYWHSGCKAMCSLTECVDDLKHGTRATDLKGNTPPFNLNVVWSSLSEWPQLQSHRKKKNISYLHPWDSYTYISLHSQDKYKKQKLENEEHSKASTVFNYFSLKRLFQRYEAFHWSNIPMYEQMPSH